MAASRVADVSSATNVNRVGRLALIAAVVGPIQVVLGSAIAGSLWSGYDPIVRTISDLAADDSPVQWIMSSFFFLGGTMSIFAAISAKVLALPGRIAILAGGLATYGLTLFTTPSQTGFSTPHRVFAIISFILFSAWPLFAMRLKKGYPPVIRPFASIVATLIFTVISLWFLSTWTNPSATNVGLVERIIAVSQSWYLAAVIWICWFWERKRLSAKP